MNRPLTEIRIQFKNAILLSTVILLLVGCSQKPALTTSATPSSTDVLFTQPVPLQTEISTSTATPTLIPAEPAQDASAGLIVFSMGDGTHTHLFAYNPYSLPVTRFSANDWDDENPTISPDGTKIAFSSNRDGQWDIYILSLITDTTTRLTQTQTYDGSPVWSPDGQYLVYETLNGDNIDLIIQSTSDASVAPVQLTTGAGDNFDPAWSPDGRYIAFSTNRAGRSQVWLANLQSADNRFTPIASSDTVDYTHPAWSPDGSTLAWCKQDVENHVEVFDHADPTATARDLGLGCSPVWSPDGKAVLATLAEPNEQYLVAYTVADGTLALPLLKIPANIQSMDWKSASLTSSLSNYINLQNLAALAALFEPALSLPASATGRKGVVSLRDVDAPNAYLADTTDETFTALRQAIGHKLGWDFLASLENAYLPISSAPSPGIAENWLFTGRAIAVNTVPLEADWMVVSREDYQGKTYWRLWVKCLDQTGGCGLPMKTSVWNFDARYSGNTQAYEDGGALTTIPTGYWVDFSEFADRFGWERLPAESNWRYYYEGILFNQFVFKQGLTWRQAMLEIYPPEALKTLGFDG